MKGRNLAIVIVVLLAIVVLIAVFNSRKPTVTVPESGPALIEERVPTDPEAKLAFDRRKAASACRIAIMQTATDPTRVEFAEDLDKTPATTETNGDFTFTVAVNVRATDTAAATSRKVHCRAHQEETGWSIAEIRDLAG